MSIKELTGGTPSALPFVSLVNDDNQELQISGLKNLNKMVGYAWHEASDALSRIESFVEDPKFPQRQLAASVASKLLFNLEAYDDSLRLALIAGEMFDLSEKSQYVEVLIVKCMESYRKMRQQIVDAKNSSDVKIDEKMEKVIDRMFEVCIRDRQFKQSIGYALECRRLDKLRNTLEQSEELIEDLMKYTHEMCEKQQSKTFRTDVLRLLMMVYQQRNFEGNFDHYKIAKIQFSLNLSEATAQLLLKLVKANNDDVNNYLDAYQIAFDICEKENQGFQNSVYEKIQAQIKELGEEEKSISDRLNQISTILRGEVRDRLYLQFLKKNNHMDMAVIQNIKKCIGPKSSILQGATIWAYGMMNAYTTNDTFLKDNMQWVGNVTNWNRFNATATLGIIHSGNKKEALAILNPYFSGSPVPEQQSSPYTTAGAYFAYGLIHQNSYTPELLNYFKDGFRNSGQNEAVQHGVSLGLGLCAMATKDTDIYNELKEVLYNNADSAIIGEGAGYGMGLVMIGAADQESIQDTLTHIGDQNHEKIIRSLSMSLALQMYGKEDAADTLVEQMLGSKDPIVRYGGMFAIGAAYAGTTNNKAFQKLLTCAVGDVHIDVKRAAMMNIGFVLCKTPEQVPLAVKHLAESYDPHLRYGAAMAVGIGCAGTGLNQALKLLAPLTNDQVDFVRQGALIALAMVFVQVTEAQEPKVATIKKLYNKMIEDRHEDILSRMGAIIAMGIINAGGRNCSISLTTRDGNLRQNAIVGLMLFVQHWYWYPMLNFINLALTPTALIGLDANLKVPKSFKCISESKPSTYKYPDFIKADKDKKKEKVAVAVLSTTTKAKARKDRKEGKTGEPETPEPKKKDEDAPMQDDNDAKNDQAAEDKDKKDEEEPLFQELKNPSRVVKQQESVIKYPQDGRYMPVLSTRFGGFVILREANPSEEQELFYDDEERDVDAPNPDQYCDMKLPAAFEFDPEVQNEGEDLWK